MYKYNKGEVNNLKNIMFKLEVIFFLWIFIYNLKLWIIWRLNLFCYSYIFFWLKYWIYLFYMVNYFSGNFFVLIVIVNFIYYSYIKFWDVVNSGNGWLIVGMVDIVIVFLL